ncbi:DUF4244 domain-containing protein [Lentzea sp. NPDC058450]|uniref:DUF4244 domain-containing protein n=1 Tax=Lentzea sp. NPDC058450 TaxID=3346505 RepID=UPI00364FCD86
MELLKDDSGMSTVEYAIGTLAAAALAALMYVIVTSDGLRNQLQELIQGALESV